jgi:hypothetical protein
VTLPGHWDGLAPGQGSLTAFWTPAGPDEAGT